MQTRRQNITSHFKTKSNYLLYILFLFLRKQVYLLFYSPPTLTNPEFNEGK